MTFLNALLALGALAFTIPLAIHLLFRSRFKTVDWGAWQLLDSVIRTNRRRMQLRNLLLLLLRCAIPILLAFCLARPVLTGFKSLPGDAPRSMVIVLDDSRSMMTTVGGKPSRFDQAKQGLVELLGNMTRRDEIMLLTSTTIDSPPITTGPADAIDRIKKLRAKGGPVDLGKLSDAAVEAIEQASHGERSVLVVSDFQSANASRGTADSLERIADRIADSQPKPVVSFWNTASTPEEISNVSVDQVSVDSPAVVAGRNVQLSARIRNASDNPARDLRVIWSIDGVPLTPRLGSVDARSTTTARLSHRFDEPGIQEVTVSVEHGDAISADNRRSIAVDVMREINVALVDGRPSKKPLEGQADFLAIALSPFAFGGDDQPDSVKASVARLSQIEATIKSQAAEVIVLANVASIPDDEKAALTSFVLAGGSLVIFDGNYVKPETYNAQWKCEDGNFLLPARLEEIAGDPKKRDETAQRVGELSSLYTPWKSIGGNDARAFSDVEIYARRSLRLIDDKVNDDGEADDTANAGSILLRTASGDPLVVSASRGRGQVIQFAIPCNPSWTSLPLRMVYLPMMQQMVLDLAGRRKTTTLEVGQPIVVPLDEFASDTGAEDKKDARSNREPKVRYTIETPDEGEVAVDVTDGEQLVWTKTSVPGTYRFRKMTERMQPDLGSTDSDTLMAQTMRVVEVPDTESQLRMLDSNRLSTLAEKLDANVYSSVSEVQSDDRTRRFGREVWRWLLFGLLIAMIAELFLQQRLVSRPATRTTP